VSATGKQKNAKVPRDAPAEAKYFQQYLHANLSAGEGVVAR
jgi:hypothetical protein